MAKRPTGKESVRTAGQAQESNTGRAASSPAPTPGAADAKANGAGKTKRPPRTREQQRRKSTIEVGASPLTGQSVKTYVLDTNVLLHNPTALFVFEENTVVVPFAVLEELDTFKGENNDLGRNSRQCIRHLDALRENGHLPRGVAWSAVYPSVGPTGVVRVETAPLERPAPLRNESADNRIIAVAYACRERGERTVFVSKDINARIKADALGIDAEDFENQKVDADRLYTGYVALDVPADIIDELYRERMLPISKLEGVATLSEDSGAFAFADPDERDDDPAWGQRLASNQFVIMKAGEDESHTGLGRRLADTDHIVPVSAPRKPVFGIMARNVQQTMGLDLLLDDDVKLITLLGTAGTGKTLLALAAGMTKVFQEERYERLLVARPIMPLGKDIGYLPGDKDEKLFAWMQPIFDNLEYLLSTRGSHMQLPESYSADMRIKKLIADGRLVLEPLTYIRGRSIPHQFMIVDEAQNLTPHEVKTIISRVGEGTRLILTGDVGQIDNPYLDASSNGLSYAVERMKGLGLVGHVTLAKSERSDLASLATERL